jgi:hypothetical protein
MANSARIQSYWLGAPLIDLDRRAFESTLLQRFAPNMEHALAYVDKIAEQQAAKGNALLVFNALLFGMFTLSSAATMQPRLFALGGLLALFSALLLLGAMYTRWGSTRDHASAEREFRLSCDSCYRRAYVLTFALCATALATFIAAVPLLARFAP